MNTSLLLSMLGVTFSLTVPLVLAALGGLVSERSGVINIALEGKMLAAACGAAAGGLATGDALGALGGALLTGVLFSLLHGWLTQALKIDHVISGMGINVLAIGLTRVAVERLPLLRREARVPVFPNEVIYGAAFTAVICMAFYLKRTRGGLRLLAVGADPDKARQMGVNPMHVRYVALIATGVFCGLAGMLLVGSAGSFSKEMTAGRGYIALAALILGGWRPWQTFFACLFFGFVSGLQLLLQNTNILGATLPPEFFQALPYLATLTALAWMVQNRKAPAGLGKP